MTATNASSDTGLCCYCSPININIFTISLVSTATNACSDARFCRYGSSIDNNALTITTIPATNACSDVRRCRYDSSINGNVRAFLLSTTANACAPCQNPRSASLGGNVSVHGCGSQTSSRVWNIVYYKFRSVLFLQSC